MTGTRKSLALLGLCGALVACAEPALADSVRRAADRSVVAVTAGDRQGSGVAWTGGRVVTASRIVGDASSARIVTSSGRVLDAEVQSTRDGLAVLSVDGDGLRAISTTRRSASSGYIAAGPVGFGARISAVSLRSRDGVLTAEGAIPGRAVGAPILDARGRLLGVVTRRTDAQARAADTGTVRDAVSAAGTSGSGGFPWLLIPAALLLIAAVVAGVLLVRRRRAEQQRRALARLQARGHAGSPTPPPPPAPPSAPGGPGNNAPTTIQGAPVDLPPPPSSAPTPAAGTPAAPAPAAPAPYPEDDFEIVLKTPREGG